MNHLLLLLLLGSNDYKQREFAHQQLLRDPTPLLLLTANSENKELAHRSQLILRVYNQRQLEQRVGDIKKFPWISETCKINDSMFQYYLQRARREIGMHGAPDWADYRLATKFYFLENGIIDFDLLQREEEEWTKKHGHRFR